LDANGGDGESGSDGTWQGGGGGGGRIAVYAVTNSFAGNFSAAGGDGAWPGQDGTIYAATNLFISGSVTNANGIPQSGIAVQPSGLSSAITDTNGFYSAIVPLFWTGVVTPSANGSIFIPGSRDYSGLANDATNQNFLIVSPGAFNIADSQLQGTNLSFSWYGIAGVIYQPQYSTNLVDWLPWGGSLTGSNAPIELTLPVTGAPQLFFRLRAGY
ncbi:MAG: hypothetical protein ACREFE_13120, partial [Limisphaerales bacterium]